VRREQVEPGGATELGRTSVTQIDAVSERQNGAVSQHGGPFERYPIQPNILKWLNQVVFASTPKREGSATQITANAQIDVIPREGLADRDLVGIAHGITTDPIDPKNFLLDHGGLGRRWRKKTSDMAHHSVIDSQG